jgi:hypothetical protein
MAVNIIEDQEQQLKVLYCSTTMVCFGPVFYEDDEPEDFLEWLDGDPRLLADETLNQKVWEWRSQQEAGE